MDKGRLIEPVEHHGIYYWPTYGAALAAAIANGWPQDRLIEYKRGWAIQIKVSGDYVGPKTLATDLWAD